MGGPAWSADGQWLAAESRMKDDTLCLAILSVAGREAPRTFPLSLDAVGESCLPVWAPIGERLAYATSPEWQTQVVVRSGSGEALISYPLGPASGTVNALAWTADGKTLAMVVGRDVGDDLVSSIVVASPPGLLQVTRASALPFDVDDIAWEDETHILVRASGGAGLRGDLVRVDVSTGAWAAVTKSARILPGTWRLTTRGSVVAVAGPPGSHGDLYALDVREGRLACLLRRDSLSRSQQWHLRSVTWAHDGTMAAWVSDGGLCVYDRARRKVVRVTSSPSDDWPAWSPDGRQLAFARDRKAILILDPQTKAVTTVWSAAATPENRGQ